MDFSPPREGNHGAFADSATRLAGLAGVMFGWAPAAFWCATPAELGALVVAVAGDGDAVPPDAALLAKLREVHPDG